MKNRNIENATFSNELQKYVAYYRVSTTQQGTQGNGLEIQQNELEKFVARRGGKIVQSFSEMVSGSKAQRKALNEALEMCEKHNYTLLVHKIDRLSRETTLIEILREKRINFVFANMPDANPLTIDLLLVIAKHERTTINERTSAGQKATIKKYGKLHHIKGSANTMTTQKQANAVLSIKEKALHNENNKRNLAFIEGFLHLRNVDILKKMKKAGFKTSTGKDLTKTHILRYRRQITTFSKQLNK